MYLVKFSLILFICHVNCYKYLGCINATKDFRLHRHDSSGISLKTCSTTCKFRYQYMALKNGTECFCNNNYDLHGKTMQKTCSHPEIDLKVYKAVSKKEKNEALSNFIWIFFSATTLCIFSFLLLIMRSNLSKTSDTNSRTIALTHQSRSLLSNIRESNRGIHFIEASNAPTFTAISTISSEFQRSDSLPSYEQVMKSKEITKN